MSNEIWMTTSAKGTTRYYRYSTYAGRALPVAKADAELGLATGAYTLVAKPSFVGR